MKRKFLAILGLTTPLILILLCGAVILLGGLLGWWFGGEEAGSRLIRVIPLPPLTTPVGQGPGPADPSQPGAIPAEAPAGASESEGGAAEGEAPPAPETGQEDVPFVLPPGSVNAITQEGVATRLIIPKLSVDAPIVLSPLENQSWKVDHLGREYVGHLEGTAPPGSSSNTVLAAHVTLAEGGYGPFAELSHLSLGDELYVYYGDQIFKYVVDDYQVVDRTAVEVTYPSEQGRVTLITCTNWSPQEGRYLERVVIRGYLAGG